jgi:hypothetical protein
MIRTKNAWISRNLSLVMGIVMFNFSIYLAEIDVMQKLKPSKQLIELLISFGENPDLEEEQVGNTLELDLFFHHKSDRASSLPYYMLGGMCMHELSPFVSHPRETVTPPPEG